MASGADTVRVVWESAPSSGRRAGITYGRLVLDLIFSALLLAMLVYGALYWVPAITGKPHRPIAVLLVVTLLPITTLVALSLIERLAPAAGPRKSLKNWFLHLQIDIFYEFMAGFAGAFAAVGSAALARRFGFNLGLIDLRFAQEKGLIAMLGAAWLSLAIVFDFFFYWLHRTMHKVPFLWAHHKMHHMDTELEALTVVRQNWIEVFIAALFVTMPGAILFKVDNIDLWQLGLMGAVTMTLFRTLLVIGHMNVRLQTGWLSMFFCSPQLHRIHHSLLPQHLDKNFAFILPLWDVLFGTYYAPAKGEFPPTGVEGEQEIRSFWEAQIFTQREWWRMFRAWYRKRQSDTST